jgi:hypothetical protein
MKAVFSSLICLCVLPSSLFAAAPVDYQRDVKPILARSCTSCHGAGKQKGSLRLDTAAAALKGGDTGPAVVPGKSAASPLYQSVSGGKDAPRMPPKGRLTPVEIATLKAWIDGGAKAPAQEQAAAAQAGNKPAFERRQRGDDDDDDDREREKRMKGRGRDRRQRREREDR